jgi:putative endonuclease
MTGCYIIRSEKLGRYYVGATHDQLELRIEKHNNGSYGQHRFTSTANDWRLLLFIPAPDYARAIRIERKLKSMKSSIYIRNLAKYPELLEKLVSSTRLFR